MTQVRKIIRTKVWPLELVRELGNVSQVCKIMGYSKDNSYRFKELYVSGGEVALMEDEQYNETKSRQGRWCSGEKPMQIFRNDIDLAKEKSIVAD